MKALLSWLREFAPDIDGHPDALSDILSSLGLTVEDMTILGSITDDVVLGRVVNLRPHPDADRIQLVDVDDGSGADPLQVCCGAFNMKVGDLIPLAQVGTVMPNGLKIQRRRLRGQLSNGMCCSAAELQMGDDSDGILILNNRVIDAAQPGMPLSQALGLEVDVLWDLEVGANRPDAMCVMGVARDLAAKLGVAFVPPDWSPKHTEEDAAASVSVEIIDPTLCGRFSARLLRNVSVGASPLWLAKRLTMLGMRPINNVVDISNYVMLEMGQPSHTFDLAQVPDGKLRVRRATEGERLVTLDGVERVLAAGDGVIADANDTVIGIAGVMGGASTEISADTSDVLLEMAWWDPPSVSRTVKRLNLSSEAATRFRRGTDWGHNIDRCFRRFAQLAAASGITLAAGTVEDYGNLPSRAPLRVRTSRVNGLLGTALSRDEIAAHLQSIGFDVGDAAGAADAETADAETADAETAAADAETAAADAETADAACDAADADTAGADAAGDAAGADGDLDVIIPTWRWDTATETDIAEEVARLHGYHQIKRTVPTGSRAGALTEYQQGRRLVREVLIGAGCDEIQPMPFLAPGALAAVGLPEDGVTVTNPLDVNESVLRTSLLPAHLKALAYNQRHSNWSMRFFEIGHVYLPPPADQLLPDEREYLGVALADSEAPAAVEVLDLLIKSLALPGSQIRMAELPGLHPTRSAEVIVAGRTRGVVGEVDPAVLDAFNVTGRVAWLQLDLGEVLSGPRGNRSYHPISKYPASTIDLAFVADDSTPAADLERAIRTGGGSLLVDVELFDVYRGSSVDDGTRSLAYRLRYQAPDRTLSDEDIAVARQACINEVARRTGAVLRS